MTRARLAMWTDDDRVARDRSLAHVRFDPTMSCVPPSARVDCAVPVPIDDAVTMRFERRRRTWPRGTPIVLPTVRASR